MRTIIIEDDPFAAQLLEDVLKELDYIQLLGVCEDVKSAQGMMLKTPVDLIFLDVVLPDVSGIEFLKLLENQHALVILMSGDKSYAVDGFDFEVTDFLSKPFQKERVFKATMRALRQFEKVPHPDREYLFIKEGQRHQRIFLKDIYYVASAQNYVEVHTADRKYLELSTLKDFKKRLPESDFIQSHRQYIINLSKVSQTGILALHLDNGTEIPLGAKYKEEIFKKLGIK